MERRTVGAGAAEGEQAQPLTTSRSPITTHVLDTCIGRPAPDVRVTLERLSPGSNFVWEAVAHARTNADGRIPDLLPPSHHVEAGQYRIAFDTEEYMERCKAMYPDFFLKPNFYPRVMVQFRIAPDQQEDIATGASKLETGGDHREEELPGSSLKNPQRESPDGIEEGDLRSPEISNVGDHSAGSQDDSKSLSNDGQAAAESTSTPARGRQFPDPDSPTSQLLERAAQRSLLEAERRANLEFEEIPRFDYQRDIARNPRLARAARLELDAAASAGGTPPVGTPSAANASLASKQITTSSTSGVKDLYEDNSAASDGATGSTVSSSPVKGHPQTSSNHHQPVLVGSPLSSQSSQQSISVPLSMTISSSMDGIAAFGHGADIDRQAVIIAQLDKDARNESRINADMACVLLKRVSSGRNAAERVLSAIQAFASAEATFAKAAEAVAAIQLTGEADGPTLRQAIVDFSVLPSAVGETHAKTASALATAVQTVRDITQELRVATAEISDEAAAAQRSVDSARKGLKVALIAHRDACRSFDTKLAEKNKIGSRSRGLESDPWIAEGRLVEKQSELQVAQTRQRRYLGGAFRRVGELERRRIDATGLALMALTEACSQAVASVPSVVNAADRAVASLQAVDNETDLEAFTAVAGQCVRNGDALSQRQAETIEHLGRELFGSAEIVRQGPMFRLRPASNARRTATETLSYGSIHDDRRVGKADPWEEGYGILTRAGFLHWFAPGEDGEPKLPWGPSGGPTISLNLARCSFETGDAPSWRLVETLSSGWTLGFGSKMQMASFRAVSVEASMMWTADIREIMAACGALSQI